MAQHRLVEQLVDWSRCVAYVVDGPMHQPLSCSMCKRRRECPGWSDFLDYRREECVPMAGTVNVERIRRLVYEE